MSRTERRNGREAENMHRIILFDLVTPVGEIALETKSPANPGNLSTKVEKIT